MDENKLVDFISSVVNIDEKVKLFDRYYNNLSLVSCKKILKSFNFEFRSSDDFLKFKSSVDNCTNLDGVFIEYFISNYGEANSILKFDSIINNIGRLDGFNIENILNSIKFMPQLSDNQYLSLYNNLSSCNKFKWVYGCFNGDNNCKEKRIAVMKQYLLFYNDGDVSNIFIDYIRENEKKLNLGDIRSMFEVSSSIYYSESIDIKKIKFKLLENLYKSNNPLEFHKFIDNIFVKGCVPAFGKNFIMFKFLYPFYKKGWFDKSNKLIISPMLVDRSSMIRDVILFNDLFKITVESNSLDFKKYLKDLENGNGILSDIYYNKGDVLRLDENRRGILNYYINCVDTLFGCYNYFMGKKYDSFVSGNLDKDVSSLVLRLDNKNISVSGLLDYMVNRFCGFSNIKSFDDLKVYMDNVNKFTNERNKDFSKRGDFKLEKGDLIKGISNVNHFDNFLKNGVIAHDFLGSYRKNDRTPLDADLFVVDNDYDNLSSYDMKFLSKYGDIYLILKNNSDRINVTRSEYGQYDGKIKSDGFRKIEAFKTTKLKDHYGIRAGFSSSYISFIVTDIDTSRLESDLVNNNIYIPIVDTKGNLVFSYEDYGRLSGNEMMGRRKK